MNPSQHPNPEMKTPSRFSRALERGSRPPAFDDPEMQRLADMAFTITIITLVATLAAYLAALTSPRPLAVIATVSLMLGSEIIAYLMLIRGHVRGSATLVVLALTTIMLSASLVGGGVRSAPFAAIVIVIVIAGLLISESAAIYLSLACSAAGLVLLILEVNQLLPDPPLIPPTSPGFWILSSVIFLVVAGMIYLATRSLRRTVRQVQEGQTALASANLQLQTARQDLAHQVQQRTAELEQRSRYLQATVEIGRAAASILDPDRLMRDTVDLIRQQFDLYYTGLFTLDASGTYAVLRAGTGEAGRTMLQRGHRLPVNVATYAGLQAAGAPAGSMVGWAIANAQPRLTLETRSGSLLEAGVEGHYIDPVRLATPELPDTRSEAAIPMRSRGRVIGALTVQSVRPGAFGEMEISIFQSIADQVAVALDNARLFEESRRSLDEARQAYTQASRQAWEEFLAANPRIGYRYRQGQIEAIRPALAELQHESGREGEVEGLSIPIVVRGQTIGALRLSHPAARTSWAKDEQTLLQSLADQLGVALDSARLYQDTQRLAFREQLTGEVTSRIRETLNIETILRTAVEEIRGALELPEVMITIGAPPGETYEPSTHDE